MRVFKNHQLDNNIKPLAGKRYHNLQESCEQGQSILYSIFLWITAISVLTMHKRETTIEVVNAKGKRKMEQYIKQLSKGGYLGPFKVVQ